MTDFLYIQHLNNGPTMDDGLPVLLNIGTTYMSGGITFMVSSYSLPDPVFHEGYDLVVNCYEVKPNQDMRAIMRELKIDKIIN